MTDPHVIVHADLAQHFSLLEGEAAAVAKAIPSRQAEFSTGRHLARRGMRDLGMVRQPIPMGPDRAPVWPHGIVGSISHTKRCVVAAVAKSNKIKALGIDIEQDRALEPAVAARIVMPHDCTDPALATVVFSAKEAVYKAMYPMTRTLWGFDAVTILVAQDVSSFQAKLNQPAGPYDAGTTFEGAIVRQDGLIATSLVCPL